MTKRKRTNNDIQNITVNQHEHHLTWNMFNQIRNLKKSFS